MAVKIPINDRTRDTDWAQVELFRWQHGALPSEPKQAGKSLDESIAFQRMADGIESALQEGRKKDVPPPFSVCAVLRYAGQCVKALAEEGE